MSFKLNPIFLTVALAVQMFFASAACAQSAPATQPTTQPMIQGMQILVAFDMWGGRGGVAEITQRTGLVEAALKKAGVAVVEKVDGISSYLLGPVHKKPEEILAQIPFRQGAVVFENGNFVRSIPFENPYQKGEWLEAAPFAVARGGVLGQPAGLSVEDLRTITQTPGVKAEIVNFGPP